MTQCCHTLLAHSQLANSLHFVFFFKTCLHQWRSGYRSDNKSPLRLLFLFTSNTTTTTTTTITVYWLLGRSVFSHYATTNSIFTRLVNDWIYHYLWFLFFCFVIIVDSHVVYCASYSCVVWFVFWPVSCESCLYGVKKKSIVSNQCSKELQQSDCSEYRSNSNRSSFTADDLC